VNTYDPQTALDAISRNAVAVVVIGGLSIGRRKVSHMKLGICTPIGFGIVGELVDALGPALEQRGFESVWVSEHVVLFDKQQSRYPYTADGQMPIPPTIGMADPFVALTFLAARTTTLRLGTGVCILPQRNPVYTAKQVADLDVVSGGRAEFGVGLGWLREEYEALDVPWPGRGARADDYLQVIRSLWVDEVSAFAGDYYSLSGARMYPKPVQSPHPAIHIGGDSAAALNRVAAYGQGWFGMGWTPDALGDQLALLDAALARHGRNRDDIEISISPPLGVSDRHMIAKFADLGVDRVIDAAIFTDIDSVEATLDQTMERLGAAV
jgi:probable F420-dependent oxidoreductase